MAITLDSEDGIFEILGMSHLESSEKLKLLEAIRQAARKDFVNREARDILSEADYKALREKTAILIKNLVKTRIDDYGLHGDTRGLRRMFEVGDWDGISKRLGAIRFIGDLSDLIDRAVSKSAPYVEAMSDRLDGTEAVNNKPDISDLFDDWGDSYSGEPCASEKDNNAEGDIHILEAMHSEIAALDVFRKELAMICDHN
jgi:hypothetical protein